MKLYVLPDREMTKKSRNFRLDEGDEARLAQLTQLADTGNESEAVRFAIKVALYALQRGDPVFLTPPPAGVAGVPEPRRAEGGSH